MAPVQTHAHVPGTASCTPLTSAPRSAVASSRKQAIFTCTRSTSAPLFVVAGRRKQLRFTCRQQAAAASSKAPMHFLSQVQAAKSLRDVQLLHHRHSPKLSSEQLLMLLRRVRTIEPPASPDLVYTVLDALLADCVAQAPSQPPSYSAHVLKGIAQVTQRLHILNAAVVTDEHTSLTISQHTGGPATAQPFRGEALSLHPNPTRVWPPQQSPPSPPVHRPTTAQVQPLPTISFQPSLHVPPLHAQAGSSCPSDGSVPTLLALPPAGRSLQPFISNPGRPAPLPNQRPASAGAAQPRRPSPNAALFHPHTTALVQHILPHVAHLTPADLTDVAWGLAKLHYTPTDDLLASFLAASQEALPSYTPKELALTIWACARWHAPPPDSWLEPFSYHCREKMLGFTSQHLSMTLWSFAVLRVRPGATLVSSMALEAQVQLRGLSPQGTANLVWALATLGYQPSAPWARSMLAHVAGLLPSCHAPVTLCNMAWGLARWGCRPDDEWLGGFSAAAMKQVHAMKRTNLVVLAASMAELGYVPGTSWISGVVKAFVGHLDKAEDEYCVRFVVAVAKLWRARNVVAVNHAEWQDWMQQHWYVLSQLVASCRVSASALSEKQLVAFVMALQQLQLRPQSAFLEELFEGVEQRKGALSMYQYAAVHDAFDLIRTLPVAKNAPAASV